MFALTCGADEQLEQLAAQFAADQAARNAAKREACGPPSELATDELAELLRSEFASVLRFSPTAFTLDCRDDGSPTMGRLQLELVRLKKLILKDNAHRRSPEICEKIK